MEGNMIMLVHASEYKNKQLMAKVNLLNQAESLMSESNFSQLHGNANKKNRKSRYFIGKLMSLIF